LGLGNAPLTFSLIFFYNFHAIVDCNSDFGILVANRSKIETFFYKVIPLGSVQKNPHINSMSIKNVASI
jgi:hypothetical protein